METSDKRSSFLQKQIKTMMTPNIKKRSCTFNRKEIPNKRSRCLQRRNKPVELETPNFVPWSELPIDILRSVFERLSFIDFHRAKILDGWLILFPEEEEGCLLFNPDETRVYKQTKRDFSGFRFLGNSDNWFLVLDPLSQLSIIDVFSEKRIDLPPLESIKGGRYSLKRVGDTKFEENVSSRIRDAKNLRGILRVDEKTEEYVVVWFFETGSKYLAFWKNGKDHYSEIPTRMGVPDRLKGVSDIVLKGYYLYVLTNLKYIRILDLSGQGGFKDVSKDDGIKMCLTNDDKTRCNIAVTRSGEVLLVHTILNKKTKTRTFRVYKKDLDVDKLVEVDSLGDDEVLLLDSGINVPADHSVSLEPNFIYFTRLDRLRSSRWVLNICVFNLATKGFERFPGISELKRRDFADLKLKDARWFLHRT